jgi:NADP-dependent 3-hydroxy acid dehydrogenase YdfG
VTAFEGKACVVTGASSGVGRALTLALAQAGAHVWALGRDAQRLESVVTESGGRVVPVLADLERSEEIGAAAAKITAGGKGVDVLVHSAGEIALGSTSSLQAADFDRQYQVNLRAPFLLTRALLPALKRSRGQVVFVNSSAGLRSSSSNALYAATKHGLKALADGLRDEVNADGVRVTSVYLGRTATPMQVAVHEQEGRPYEPEFLMQTEDVVHVVLAALSLPPSAELTDASIRPMSKLPSHATR